MLHCIYVIYPILVLENLNTTKVSVTALQDEDTSLQPLTKQLANLWLGSRMKIVLRNR